MSAWTPGPWKTGRNDMQSYDAATGEPFTNVYHATMTFNGERVADLPLVIARCFGARVDDKANARLIAAAPEMAELLRYHLAALGAPGLEPALAQLRDDTRALLARIEGDET